MSSRWTTEAAAVLLKEARSELRARHGLFTAGLFGMLAVVAMSVASFGDRPGPGLAAGMLCVTLAFAAVSCVPRTLITEEEQGTFDLLRLTADPGAAFFGKLLYNLAFVTLLGSLLAVLFVGLTGVDVRHPGLFWGGVLLQGVGLAAGASLCGALVLGAANRWILATALALPLLLPQVFLGVGVLRVAFGTPGVGGAHQSLIALGGFALVLAVAGPVLVERVWRAD